MKFEILGLVLPRTSFHHQQVPEDGGIPGPGCGALFQSSVPQSTCQLFGVIPKSNQPGKWRLILDLSARAGHSVNEGIPKPPYSIQYATVDAFIDGIIARGRGTLMGKF